MNKVLFVGIFALPPTSISGAAAQEIPGFSGHNLHEACSSGNEALHVLCTAYLRGQIFGLQFGQKLASDGHPICVVPDPEAARLLVDKFIADHPEILEDDKEGAGDYVAIMALLRAFPCKPPKS